MLLSLDVLLKESTKTQVGFPSPYPLLELRLEQEFFSSATEKLPGFQEELWHPTDVQAPSVGIFWYFWGGFFVFFGIFGVFWGFFLFLFFGNVRVRELQLRIRIPCASQSFFHHQLMATEPISPNLGLDQILEPGMELPLS